MQQLSSSGIELAQSSFLVSLLDGFMVIYVLYVSSDLPKVYQDDQQSQLLLCGQVVSAPMSTRIKMMINNYAQVFPLNTIDSANRTTFFIYVLLSLDVPSSDCK